MSGEVSHRDPGPVVDPDEAHPGSRPNPYVGPRSFAYGEMLYGRAREVGELRDLLIAERIVLLYSPSGAGKSSLLAAGLRPELEQRDFVVLPTIRVSHEPPDSLGGGRGWNRYALSTLLSLEEGRPAGDQLPLDELAALGLDSYLRSVTGELGPERDPVLVFDQFEELFTLDPTDQADKATFLHELGVALRDRGRWALFAMREDFIAQLDPYLAQMPKRFASRYRLDLLGTEAAISAARSPAEAAGVAFSPDAADRLVDDLRRVRVQRGTNVTEELGPYVEPVQLQVVCRQLWATLPGDATSIEASDVEAVGSVDDALADFYVDQVGLVAASTGTSEREIRGWIDDQLISEQGFRTQALEGPGPNGPAVLRELENAHLIRADRRRGTDWYELAHDRLVPPVQASNAAWREAHLSTLQREAQGWDRHSRPAGLLLTGGVLTEAEAWATEHREALSPVDLEYLEACRGERDRNQREQRASRRNRRLAVVASVVGLLAIGLLVAALLAFANASKQKRDAEKAKKIATDALVKQQAQVAASGWLGQGNTSTTPAEKFLSWRNAYTADPAGLDDDLKRKLLTAQHYLRDAHPYITSSASLDRTGRRLARVDETRRVELVDVGAQGSGAAPTVLTEPGDVVQFSPLDDRVAVYSADAGAWTVWDTAARQEVATLPLAAPNALAFSRLGAIAGTSSGDLVLWDSSGKLLEAPEDTANEVISVALAPDASRLAAVTAAPGGHELRVWEQLSGTWQPVPIELQWHPSATSPPAFSAAGDRLAVGDTLGALHVLSLTAQGAVDDVLPGDPDAPAAPIATTFLPDASLRTLREDGAVETWSASPAGWVRSDDVVTAGPSLDGQLSGNGERVLVQDGSVARVYDATTGALVLGPDVGAGGVTREGRSVVRGWNGETLEQGALGEAWQQRPDPSLALALSPDGVVLATLEPTPSGGLVLGGDVAGLPLPCPVAAEPLARVPGQDLVVTLAVSDGAASLAVARPEGVCTWPQVGADDLDQFSPSLGAGARSLDLSADGALAASGGNWNDVGLVELMTIGPNASNIPVFLDEVATAVRVSDDGQWLVAGDGTGELSVRRTADEQALACLIDTQAFSPVVAVDVTNGGEIVAVATEKRVSVFEVAWLDRGGCSYKETSGFDLLRDEGTVLSIDLSADDSRVRVLESDLHVHELDVEPDPAQVADEVGRLGEARGWPEPSVP